MALNGSNPVKALQDLIDQQLKSCQFHDTESRYFSASSVLSLATPDNVDTILTVDRSWPRFMITKEYFKQSILNCGKTLFIICVYSGAGTGFLYFLLYLRVFEDNSIPLPLSRSDVAMCGFSDEFEKYASIEGFFPPSVKEGSFRTNICTERVPVEIETSDSCGEGNHGTVYRAQIDNEYHDIVDLKPYTATRFSKTFALKSFHNQIRANQEISFVEQFFVKPDIHPHITKVYGAFTAKGKDGGPLGAGDKMYLISELADMSLDILFEKKLPYRSKSDNERWAVQQMTGLAFALAKIHQPSPGRFAFHHDIRPDNILSFDFLKFTDWGSASYHVQSEDDPSPAAMARTVHPYRPPESSGRRLTSAPHDIWALGCIFFEMLLWITKGGELDRLIHNKLTNPRTGCHWERPHLSPQGPACLTNAFQNELSRLGALEEGKWEPLIHIIRKMFVIDPEQRIIASNLAQALQSELEKF